MSSVILLNKPFQVLCQFQDADDRTTLKKYLPNHPGFYPAGRLDFDSEGLLLLTDDGPLQNYIASPKHKQPKTYWAQVEGTPSHQALQQFEQGLTLKDGPTKPAKCRAIAEPPNLWARLPPIRERQNIPTQWLEITLTEGKNRQVRRMTAAIGHPTLRLIRASIGPWSLGELQPGEHALETSKIEIPASARRNPNHNRRVASPSKRHHKPRRR
ncbi:MAG: pseudouridine synthase [Cellvibrionaceae bacterium]